MAEVRNIVSNQAIQRHLTPRGFVAKHVSWEDTSRTKGSCWGHNITDMTLEVANYMYPIIGRKNFSDVTADLPIERFSVNVGNEVAGCDGLQRITLSDYLEHLEQYTGLKVKGSMVVPRDTRLLSSAQSCILPLVDGSVEFNVRCHNYQFDKQQPATLVVVASPHGTSAQLIMERKQRIYFNRGGEKANYQARRLRDVRAEAGRPLEGAMNQEEKEQNVLFVYQIPLKQKVMSRSEIVKGFSQSFGNGFGSGGGGGSSSAGMPFGYTGPAVYMGNAVLDCYCKYKPAGGVEFGKCDERDELKESGREFRQSRGMDHAQLSVGASSGKSWDGTPSTYTIERDAEAPIRVTIQTYRVTDSGVISDDTLDDIMDQLENLHAQVGEAERGSLVTEGATGRITESQHATKAPWAPTLPVGAGPFFSF